MLESVHRRGPLALEFTGTINGGFPAFQDKTAHVTQGFGYVLGIAFLESRGGNLFLLGDVFFDDVGISSSPA